MKKFLALFLSLAMLLSMASFAVADELPTITIMFHGSNVTDDTEVLEKVNEYIADKVGAKLDVIWGTWGDFDEKVVNTLVSADSSVDMVFTCSWSADEYNTFAKNGYFLKLDDLIAEYGADLVATLPEKLMDAARIEGAEGLGVYAVNGFKDYATQNCWDVNVTLLNELGYTLDDFKAMDFYSFGDLFAKAKEVKGDSFYPFLVEPMVLERMVTGSIIVSGDSGSVNLLSLYLNQDDVSAEGPYGNKLLNKFATPEYQKFVEKMHEYYEAGYINPALAVAETSNDTRSNAQKDAAYLVGTQSYSFGYEITASEERGIEVVEQQSTATMNAQDFTNQFTAMVNADVELVYAVYYYDAVGPFLVTQARAAGYDGIIMGADGYDGALDYVSEGVDYSAFNNVIYTNHYDATDSSEVVQNYVTSYEELYGTTPLCFAALASDCMMMLQTAMETAGTAEASAVRDALADTSVTYEGVTGTFNLDETGTPVKGAAVISFVYDESVGGLEGLGTELVTTISADDIA